MNPLNDLFYPQLPNHYVYRPHLVSTVLSLLDGKQNAILLDGPPGLGCTSFLAEVAKAEQGFVLCLFVNSASLWLTPQSTLRTS